jgi:hypothetical protein
VALENLHADYGTYENRDNAIADGVYINVPGNEIHNQAMVDSFYNSVSRSVAAFMRTIAYTDEGDPIITDYQYDGRKYNVRMDTTRDGFGPQEIYSETYECLVYLDRSRPAGIPMPFFLSNDPDIYETTPDGAGVKLKDGPGAIPSPSDGAGSAFVNR